MTEAEIDEIMQYLAGSFPRWEPSVVEASNWRRALMPLADVACVKGAIFDAAKGARANAPRMAEVIDAYQIRHGGGKSRRNDAMYLGACAICVAAPAERPGLLGYVGKLIAPSMDYQGDLDGAKLAAMASRYAAKLAEVYGGQWTACVLSEAEADAEGRRVRAAGRRSYDHPAPL